MSDTAILNAAETGDLIIQVDNNRAVGVPFKLPPDLRALTAARLADAKTKNAATSVSAGDAAGASVQVQTALDKLREALRDGFNHIKGIPTDDISEAQRVQAFTHYGWEGSKLGALTAATRVNHLAELAQAGASAVLLIARYPASVMNKINNWSAVLEANEALAGGGTRQAAVEARNAARDALQKANMRVRFYYCSQSDDGEKTPELAKIGFQPRRDAGDAQPQPLPGAAGAVTFNAATRELTVTALPEHATSLRAFRKPAGGDAEPAGVSTGTTVSVTAYAPLTPGVHYEVWITGHNSRGDGAESNRVTFTA